MCLWGWALSAMLNRDVFDSRRYLCVSQSDVYKGCISYSFPWISCQTLYADCVYIMDTLTSISWVIRLF